MLGWGATRFVSWPGALVHGDKHLVAAHGRGLPHPGFADDTFVVERSPVVYRFADILAPVLSEIHCWDTECNLEFSYGQYNYTVVSPEGRIQKQTLMSYPHGRQ